MTEYFKNIDNTLQYFLNSLAIEVYRKKGVTAWFSGINNKNINVVYSNSDIADIDNQIADITDFFNKHNVQWSWVITPYTKPANLDKILYSHAFKLTDTVITMAYDLKALNSEPLLHNCLIKEVTDVKGMTDWAIVVNEAFGATEDNKMDYRDAFMKIPFSGNNAFHHYVVYVDNQPVSTGTLSLSKYGARIDNVGTRINYLRKGFGSAITQYIMHAAKRLGYEYCYLDASDEGIIMYKKLGFTECYKSKIYGKIIA